jgi:hypothetical protein
MGDKKDNKALKILAGWFLGFPIMYLFLVGLLWLVKWIFTADQCTIMP